MDDMGGIGRVTVPEGEASLPGDLMLAIEDLRSALPPALDQLRARCEEQAQAFAQLQGQVARIEAALPQYEAAFRQLDAKMTALAQQVMRNERYAALDLATKSRQPGEQAASVLKHAEAYRHFIAPPAEAGEEAPAAAAGMTH